MVRIGRDPVQYDSQVSGNSDVIFTANAVKVAGQPNAVPIQFLDLFCRNISANTTLYLMVFDLAAVPANATIPAFMPLEMLAGTMAHLDLSHAVSVGGQPATYGPQMLLGMCWAASTTSDALTIDNSSSLWVTARYA
jgi:hypothetical protein